MHQNNTHFKQTFYLNIIRKPINKNFVIYHDFCEDWLKMSDHIQKFLPSDVMLSDVISCQVMSVCHAKWYQSCYHAKWYQPYQVIPSPNHAVMSVMPIDVTHVMLSHIKIMPCPCPTMSCHTVSCQVMLPCHAKSKHPMLCHDVISCHVTQSCHHAMPSHGKNMSCFLMSCPVMPCQVTSRQNMSCFVMMSCTAMPFQVMLLCHAAMPGQVIE